MAKEIENTMIDNNVYIFTDINATTTNETIAKLTQWVYALPLPVMSNATTPNKIYTPFEKIPENIPVLNVYINSNGGNVAQTQPILTMFHYASARGAIIRTYNLYRAGSCASVIAVSGTHGYRYMAENAYNFIHFGDISATANHTEEIEFAKKHLKRHDNLSRTIYLGNTKLTQKEIDKYYNTEGAGNLFAKQCLTKGLCDWIIMNDGRFVNKAREM